MYNQSQYIPPRGQKSPNDPNKPGFTDRIHDLQDQWRRTQEQFWEGWQHPKFRQRDWEAWDERFLTIKQWLEAHPGSTQEDYKRFRQRLRRPGSWLQRIISPPR